MHIIYIIHSYIHHTYIKQICFLVCITHLYIAYISLSTCTTCTCRYMFNKHIFTNREAKITAALNYELLLKINKNYCLMLDG